MADDGPFPGITEWKQRLNSVWLAILRAYDALGVQKRLVNLTPGMVHGQNAAFPALKCKANESRHLVPVMLRLVEQYHRGTPRDTHRVSCIRA